MNTCYYCLKETEITRNLEGFKDSIVLCLECKAKWDKIQNNMEGTKFEIYYDFIRTIQDNNNMLKKIEKKR